MKIEKWIRALIVLGVILLGTPPSAASLQAATELPLSGNGPYLVGRQEFSLMDDTRDRLLTGFVFYPSGENASPARPLVPRNDADPNLDAAPYPLILYSHPRTGDGVDAGTTLGAAQSLASYGFAVVTVNHLDPVALWLNIVNRPMDILFVFNQLAAERDENQIAGLIDFERVGVSGYSFGGFTALLFSGARIDLAAREAYCAEAGADDNGVSFCSVDPEIWQQVLDDRAQYDPPLVEGEPWSPYADERITAVMPVAPCFGPLFGEDGLAYATVPTLIVGLERDERCPYDRDALFMYEHLGSADRALLTLFNQGHTDAIFNREPQKIFNHFAVAFFGYHLQGKTEYAQYLSAEFMSGFDNLSWASPE